MRKLLLVALLAISGCAVTGTALGPSPESQIVNGNNVVNTGVTLTTVTLRRDAITVSQAESYRAILKTAAGHIVDADKRLRACRSKTATKAGVQPDPCVASVGDDIDLGIKIASDVKTVLEKK